MWYYDKQRGMIGTVVRCGFGRYFCVTTWDDSNSGMNRWSESSDEIPKGFEPIDKLTLNVEYSKPTKTTVKITEI